MFGFLSKKVSFLDIWQGTPEMHCHVLPGIDDGAKTPDVSSQLLQKYKALGCETIIATPHTMGGIYDNSPSSIKQALQSIKETHNIRLSPSSEYMLDDNFTELLKDKNLLPLADNLLLVEMSFFQPPENLFEILYEIGTKGYSPIMAHPERFAYYHANFNLYNELKKRGCKLQLNALSLSDHYGKGVQKIAHKLLLEGYYDYIGTDTHRLDHLEKLETMKVPKTIVNALEKVCDSTKKSFGK